MSLRSFFLDRRLIRAEEDASINHSAKLRARINAGANRGSSIATSVAEWSLPVAQVTPVVRRPGNASLTTIVAALTDNGITSLTTVYDAGSGSYQASYVAGTHGVISVVLPSPAAGVQWADLTFQVEYGDPAGVITVIYACLVRDAGVGPIAGVIRLCPVDATGRALWQALPLSATATIRVRVFGLPISGINPPVIRSFSRTNSDFDGLPGFDPAS